ncbi:MAG: hypothetical protein Q4F67_17515 [Propionibacteriaceae bacterium]|nr:hypothetical protein [Propionibacteriaceae bacterium]
MSATQTPTASVPESTETVGVGSSVDPAELSALIAEAVYAAGTANLELIQVGESLPGSLHTTEAEDIVLLDVTEESQLLVDNDSMYVGGVSDEAEWLSIPLDDSLDEATYNALIQDPVLGPLVPLVGAARVAGFPSGLLDDMAIEEAVVIAASNGSSTYEAESVSDRGTMLVTLTVDEQWLPSHVDIRTTSADGETAGFSMSYTDWGAVEAPTAPQGSDVAPYQP